MEAEAAFMIWGLPRSETAGSDASDHRNPLGREAGYIRLSDGRESAVRDILGWLMPVPRREFLKHLASASGSAIVVTPSLAGLVACTETANRGSATVPVTPPTPDPPASVPDEPVGSPFDGLYGELVRSLDCPELEIPKGYRCIRLSWGGVASLVRDGLVVPNAFDGMAAFPLPNGNVRLIRNHEMRDPATDEIAIGDPHYDSRASGGTTSLEVRISVRYGELAVELVDEFVSLAGTIVNCAGGPTPWGSWLSCEETLDGTQFGYDKPHGYVFEVPVDATGPVDPVPLRAMGRFVHEAVAVDSATGIVYLTEDQPGDRAGLYRFIPDTPEVLADGGQLQMMAVTGHPRFVTSHGHTQGAVWPAHWVDIADPDHEVFDQGFAAGAARFERLEGAFPGDNGIYFVSTSGGDAQTGQVFHYLPTSAEGGELRLIFESPSQDILNSPDNIVLSPHGGVLLCEDPRSPDRFIRELDPTGRIVNLVQGRGGEFAGSCFSPDGQVMFFNVQGSVEQNGSTASGTYALWKLGRA